MLPPQCLERFHHYRSNEKIITARLKVARYIRNPKILPGNIFGLISKNKMVVRGVFLSFSKEFCWPSRAKDIIDRHLNFASHYKILTGNIFASL